MKDCRIEQIQKQAELARSVSTQKIANLTNKQRGIHVPNIDLLSDVKQKIQTQLSQEVVHYDPNPELVGIFDFNAQISNNPFVAKKLVEYFNNDISQLMEKIPHGRSGVSLEHLKKDVQNYISNSQKAAEE